MFQSIKDFLPSALRRTGAERSVNASIIVETAEPIILQIIPELRPADLEVVSYRNGALHIAVQSPTVKQEISFRAEAILETLREIFPNTPIERLKFSPLMPKEEEW